MTHPLIGNEDWKFFQPNMVVHANYTMAELESDAPLTSLKTVATHDDCRETLIYNLRQHLRKALCSEARPKPHELVHTPRREIIFGTSEACFSRANWIGIRLRADQNNEEFRGRLVRMTDYLLGPVCVLLDPLRAVGDWWKTDSQPIKDGYSAYSVWSGTSNWFLQHPVTVGIATGIARQAYHLMCAGVYDDVMSSADPSEVEEVLTECSQKKALLLIKKTRPWIEVPVGRNGKRENYAFPLKTWRRMIRLQRAIRRHSYEEALNQSFIEGWNLDASEGETYDWSGAFQYWGDENNLTDAHRHLMELGAPRRKSSVS